MKKLLGVLFACVMALTLLPTALFASAQEYITLYYNESQDVTIVVGESVWYQFTPTADGFYEFRSYDEEDVDPVASLYDSSLNFMKGNDDSNGRNFSIIYELTAGETYYLEVFDYAKDNVGTFTLVVGDVQPDYVDIADSYIDLFSGVQYALPVEVAPDEADSRLTWTSSDETVATVDEHGVVTTLKGGVATIKAETVNHLTDTCEVKVTQVDGTITLDETKDIVITEDEESKDSYWMFTPEETGYYRFYSFDIVTDDSYEDIDPKGTIYTDKLGQIKYNDDTDGANFLMDVKLEGGTPYFLGLTIYFRNAVGSYKVCAKKIPVPTAVSLGDDFEMKESEKRELPVSYEPADCFQEDYKLSSSDTSVIEVEGNTIYAVGAGTAIITATSDGGLTDTVTVTVEGIETLELDKTYTLEQEEDYQETFVRYAFCPAVSGIYTIRSTDANGYNTDSWVELYDKKGNLRDSANNNADFTLSYELMAGEHYYYEVYLTDDGAASSVDFVLTKEKDSEIPEATLNTNLPVDISEPGNGAFYAFKPKVTGSYRIFSLAENSYLDPKVFVYDSEWNVLMWGDDILDDEYKNYSISSEFEAGKTYYLKSIIYYSDRSGSYTMRIEPEFDLIGDLDNNCVLNTMDALLLYTGINGQRALTEAQKAVADITGDGNINTMDALQLYRKTAGL